MGASKSKQIVETFTKTSTEIMNKTTTNISNQNNMSAVLHQKIEVDMEGANLGNCRLNIVQEGSVTMDVIVDFAAEVGVQMSAELLNKLEETAKQTIEKVRSGFSLPSIDVSSAVHSSRIEIENKVSNIVETSIKNIVEVSAENSQVIIFKGRNMIMGNCAVGQGLDFNQKGQVEVIARSISKNVIDNFMEVKAINDIMREIQQSEKLEYIGLDVGALVKGFWSTLIIAGVLVLVAIIALLVYLNYNPEVAMAGLDVAKVAIAPQTALMQNPLPRYQQPQSQQPVQQRGGSYKPDKPNKPVWPIILCVCSILLALICGGIAIYLKNKENEKREEVDKKNKEIDELNSYRE